jgi:hypothetical protein
MDFTLLMKDRGNPWRCVLLMGALLWLAGCATGSALHERGGHSAPEGPSDDGGGFGFFREQKDDFSALPLQEQIREAGRLSTHLLMLFGSAAGTATKIGTTGTRLPVLSLMADGSLAIERVSVPAGSSAAVLGVGAGAVYVLSSPEKAPDDRSDDLTAARGATQPFGGLSRAAEFGIRQYNLLRQALQGTGLRAHHLIEQRFARIMGQDARKELCVAVTPSEHQAFTNDWRAAIPYGEGTANATRELILREAARIYADYPAILQALGL